MRNLFARLASQSWFCAIFPFVGCAVGATAGYFAAQAVTPLVPLIILIIAGLYLNRFVFGTSESYLFLGICVVLAIVLYPIKSVETVAITGFIMGAIAAFAIMDWMDKPNQIELARQAKIQQRNRIFRD